MDTAHGLVVGVTAGGGDHRLARRATEALRDYLTHEFDPLREKSL